MWLLPDKAFQVMADMFFKKKTGGVLHLDGSCYSQTCW